MTADIIPFNPLDTKNLGASIAVAMLAGKVYPLGSLTNFKGAGIYALYYMGTFPAYSELSRRNAEGNFNSPIYVGKAVPSGARKGIIVTDGSSGNALYSRLNQHAKSIRAVSNLDIEDFYCRFLVLDDVWIPLGESLLITHFSPVWNAILNGFGNNTPGKNRDETMRSRWDVLHPGRSWAEKCQDRPETQADIARDVESYLRSAPIPSFDWFGASGA